MARRGGRARKPIHFPEKRKKKIGETGFYDAQRKVTMMKGLTLEEVEQVGRVHFTADDLLACRASGNVSTRLTLCTVGCFFFIFLAFYTEDIKYYGFFFQDFWINMWKEINVIRILY